MILFALHSSSVSEGAVRFLPLPQVGLGDGVSWVRPHSEPTAELGATLNQPALSPRPFPFCHGHVWVTCHPVRPGGHQGGQVRRVCPGAGWGTVDKGIGSERQKSSLGRKDRAPGRGGGQEGGQSWGEGAAERTLGAPPSLSARAGERARRAH